VGVADREHPCKSVRESVTVRHFADSLYRFQFPSVISRSGNPIGPTCEGGTSEEGRSVGESVAAIHSIAMFASIFGLNTGFTDYDNGSLWELDNAGTSSTHKDNNDRLDCYNPNASFGTSPGDFATYDYGSSVRQAFWESVHGINCFVSAGQPCVTINSGSNKVLDAKKAVYDAMQTTGLSGTQRVLVANLLSYYYYFVSQAAWNDRWWIFNHHNLVGPNPSYSPC